MTLLLWRLVARPARSEAGGLVATDILSVVSFRPASCCVRHGSLRVFGSFHPERLPILFRERCVCNVKKCAISKTANDLVHCLIFRHSSFVRFLQAAHGVGHPLVSMGPIRAQCGCHGCVNQDGVGPALLESSNGSLGQSIWRGAGRDRGATAGEGFDFNDDVGGRKRAGRPPLGCSSSPARRS